MNANSPEYRTCPLTGRTVVVAPERGLRPQLSSARPPAEPSCDCPFCPGHEYNTPGEVYAVRPTASPANGPGWDLRVVPNKYPAVRPTLPFAALPEAGHGVPGFGVHELILDTARHVADPVEYTPTEWVTTLTAYRDRVAAIGAMPGVDSVVLFKNVGAAAGASLEHAHSQAVGLPFVPPELATELRVASEYHARTGRTLLLDRLAVDREEGRFVAENQHFAAVAAFAPRFASELLVVPKARQPRFTECEDLAGLADLLRRVLVALATPAYNWCLHTAPKPVAATGFVWHFQILPRTANAAGFEWGSGCFLTTVRPEAAAAQLIARLSNSPPARIAE